MAVVCRETHLDGRTPEAFRASWMQMGAEHKVEDAQALGTLLQQAEKKLGPDAVRASMNGLSFEEAQAFLHRVVTPPPKERGGSRPIRLGHRTRQWSGDRQM